MQKHSESIRTSSERELARLPDDAHSFCSVCADVCDMGQATAPVALTSASWGRDALSVLVRGDQSEDPSPQLRTLFMQELVRRGVLAPSFVVSCSPMGADIDHTVEAIHAAFAVHRRAQDRDANSFLDGRPLKPAVSKRG